MIEAIKLAIPSATAGIPGAAASVAGSAGAGFAEFATHLAEALKAGEQAAIRGVTGEMPIQQSVEKVLEAERTLNAALAIRDKIVTAYLEISRMQI